MTTTLQPIYDAAGANVVVTSNFDAVGPAGLYGMNVFHPTSGLTWGYYGGISFGNVIANGAVTLTASATNYLVASRSTGAVSVSTSTTNWNDTTNYMRLYSIITGTTTVTSYTDYREAYGGGAAAGGMTNPMTTPGDLIIGGASGSPSRLAATTNGYVLTLASGVPVWAAATSGFSNPMTTVGDLIVGGTSGAAGRLAAGTATYVLTSNGAGVAPTWQAVPGGGGGLSYFTESSSTTTPNDTVNTAQLSANVATTNGALVLSPKGTGPILASVPTSTSSGGNVRGTYSTDWQRERSAATQVASGTGSTIVGGQRNTASNTTSIAGGYLSVASGDTSVALGSVAVASGLNAVALGDSTAASGRNTFAVGRSTTANADYSSAFGYNSTAGGLYGAIALSGGFASRQRRWATLTRSAASAGKITADGGAGSSSTQINVPTGRAFHISGRVVARQTSANEAKSWFVEILAVNDGGTLTLVGSTITALHATAGASAWDISAAVSGTLVEISTTGTSTNFVYVTFAPDIVEAGS